MGFQCDLMHRLCWHPVETLQAISSTVWKVFSFADRPWVYCCLKCFRRAHCMTYCTPFLKTQTSTSDPISFGNFVFIMFCESVCAWVSLSENEFAKSLCFNKVIQTSLTQQYLVTFFCCCCSAPLYLCSSSVCPFFWIRNWISLNWVLQYCRIPG